MSHSKQPGGRGRGRGRGVNDQAGDLSNGLANMTLANGGGGRSLVNGHPHISQLTQSSSDLPSPTQHLNEFQHLMDGKNRPAILQFVQRGNPRHDAVVNGFKNVVLEISRDPTTFDVQVPYLVENLNLASDIPDEVTREIVTTLVKWAIESESFRYTGSKLANYLALPGQLSFNFIQIFFECVTKECYDKLDNLISCTTANDYQVLEGIMLFMSELYLNMGIVTLDSTGQMIESICRIEFLKDTLKRAILKILEKAHSDKPLATVGKVLKLTGAALEEQKQTKEDKELTDLIFVHIDAISKEDYCQSNVKSLFQRVLLLRSNHWQPPESNRSSGTGGSSGGSGGSNSNGTANFANVTANDNFADYDVPIFYLSDGTPIPAHEADFVESDMRPADRFMYLHGEGDVPEGGNTLDSGSTGMGDASANSQLAHLMSHTLSAEEEEAFNMFLSQMS
ncbi:polyadenylate-binding protein-interacting protein 1-like isoform X2 [Convolutriloba macropyga]|uniref:polyadenylate-binding protein-interacting protein 1-like isoform X2 n=1 Tax=Convolutriloba macropyga TaxID=536237 RepID=UPI003F51BB17